MVADLRFLIVVFGLDSPLGLFPPGLDSCRNPLLEMADPRTTPDSHLFAKKKCKYIVHHYSNEVQ